MKNHLPLGSAIALVIVFIVSACATKEAPIQGMAAASSPAPATPPPVAPAAPVMSTAPPRAGIETEIVPGTLRDFEVNVGSRVFFAFDKSNLEDSARSTLRKQAAWLQRYPAVMVTLEGHCDERGTREYNIALGARRAASVKDYLMSLGVTAGRLETISFGKERPVCVESSENCWSQNRRAVSSITNDASSRGVAARY